MIPHSWSTPSPLTKAYWHAAAAEMKNGRVMAFAAMIVALRVALKSVSIPLAADLYIGFGYLANAFGSMVYGPVVALLGAAVSDTLGSVLFPKGPYFFPFIFTEMAGSLIFALFLYKRHITVKKVILSRFTICFFVNIVMTTPIMWLYYKMMMGRTYALFDLARIVKNLVMFPIESVILTMFLRLMIPAARKLNLTQASIDGLRFDKKSIVLLCITFVIGAGCVAGYTVYHYNNTSLSASYTSDERKEKNALVTGWVVPEEEKENQVAIITAAWSKVGGSDITYEYILYAMDRDAMAKEGVTPEDVLSFSKTPAAAAPYLTQIGSGSIRADKKTGEPVTEAAP